MIYTGAPQNTRRKPIAELNIEAGQAYMTEHGLSQIVVHAPYIINLGNTKKPENFGFAVDFLRAEVERAEALGATSDDASSWSTCRCGSKGGDRKYC